MYTDNPTNLQMYVANEGQPQVQSCTQLCLLLVYSISGLANSIASVV